LCRRRRAMGSLARAPAARLDQAGVLCPHGADGRAAGSHVDPATAAGNLHSLRGCHPSPAATHRKRPARTAAATLRRSIRLGRHGRRRGARLLQPASRHPPAHRHLRTELRTGRRHRSLRSQIRPPARHQRPPELLSLGPPRRHRRKHDRDGGPPGGSRKQVRSRSESGACGPPLRHALRALRHLLLPGIEGTPVRRLAHSEELALRGLRRRAKQNSHAKAPRRKESLLSCLSLHPRVFAETVLSYFSSASIATCEMASSTSLGAPLHAIAPIVLPSTLMGSPPRLGNPSGKASMAISPFFNESSAAPEGCP